MTKKIAAVGILFFIFAVVLSWTVTYLCYTPEIKSFYDFWHVLKREYRGSLVVLGIPVGLLLLAMAFNF